MSIADDPFPELVRQLRQAQPVGRAKAARSLGRLGWLARDAMTALVAATRDADPKVRDAAAAAVGQMGPDAVPHLSELLRHDDKYVRRQAVWALGKLGPLAAPSLPGLVTALGDADPRTASGAAEALGRMGPDATDAVPALTEAMRGTNIVLCRLAAKALSQVGRAALPQLLVHLRHRDPFVRGEAALALGWMGPAAATAVFALIEALKAGDTGRRLAPLVADGSRTPATPVTPAVAGPADGCRVNAALALGRIGPAAAAAVPALQQVAADPHEPLREAALQAIRQIKG